ncbi:DUF488 domain-containing protein [Athalassotoga saccharophila]|uniref:DUF488 domain-containing protein n=1 Tax=Athalassotoga saccharophila TaxID=1441386 RepID=A0A6N4TD62_9BACT|nr:DUF488 family protein [Athalassotoga saccharophila]BBJ29136.1 hypothetical protein ATHSA_p20046 [Athalassotoga saccharophila]
MIKVKRVYDEAENDDGKRFLVERLWPRGIKKESIKCEWLKDVAPDTKLRKWFNHEPEKWEEFKKRYFAQLENNRHYLEPILNAAKNGNVTLLYSARDRIHNGAIVLKEYIESLTHEVDSNT